MTSKYVDDVNLVLEKIKKGNRWNTNKKCLEWSKEKEAEDQAPWEKGTEATLLIPQAKLHQGRGRA